MCCVGYDVDSFRCIRDLKKWVSLSREEIFIEMCRIYKVVVRRDNGNTISGWMCMADEKIKIN